MFPKDLLIIDFEASGSDPTVHVPLQIGAVLLDKKTLKEKKHFFSFIHQDKPFPMEDWVAKNVPLDYAAIARAPGIEKVAKTFTRKFGFRVIVAAWVVSFDIAYFSLLLKSIGLQWGKAYDHHALDLFTFAWVKLQERGWKGVPDSETVFRHFGFPSRGAHNALQDCRLEAEALRRV